jgi:hypothetical protein
VASYGKQTLNSQRPTLNIELRTQRTVVSPRLSDAEMIDKIGIMKITRNIGMFLLAVYLIVDGLLGFGLNLGPAIFLLYVVALAAGVFILVGK